MKLSSFHALSDMKPVLQNPDATGQDPVYWVFSEISQDDWANSTIIAPGKYQDEYPKTFGHYHPIDALDEKYHLIFGEGVLLLQKKYFENGEWDPTQVERVYLIKAKAGDTIVINNQFGHSWSNISNMPLITFDNWRIGHTPDDYKYIEKLQGMSYYLVEDNGQLRAVANPNYKSLPMPIWISAEEFSRLS